MTHQITPTGLPLVDAAQFAVANAGAIEKLWKCIVEKNITIFLKPWITRRDAAARREVRRDDALEKARTEIEIARIRQAGEKFLELNQISGDDEINKFRRKLEMKEEVSIAKAIIYAEEAIATGQIQDSNNSNQPTEDWVKRWRSFTAQVSDEEMLKMWGRVLADESNSPGEYSYRVLDFIHSIAKSDAELITKLFSLSLSGFYLRGSSRDTVGPLSYEEIYYLQ